MKTDNGTSSDRTCVVHVLDNRFEADILIEALEKEEIPVICREYEDSAYDGIFVPQKGWGAIYVPISQRERAEAIIQEVLSAYSEGSTDNDENGGL